MKYVYKFLALLVIGAYCLVSIFTLPNYGINWDEVSHLTRGQAYLYFFLTGKEQYDKELFKEGNRHSFYQIPQYDFRYQKVKDGDHPVLSDIASSFFNYVFYQKLGIIGDFDAYHLYGVVLVSFFLIFLYFWMEKLYGGFAAFVSVLSLILYPLFYGESHFNVQKDIPEAVYYGLALMTFYRGYVEKSAKWLIISSLFFGFGLGTKFNILFMLLSIILWLLVKERKSILINIWLLPRHIKFWLFLYPFIGFSIFYFSWPHLWFDPVKNILQVFGYYKDYGIVPPSMPQAYYIYGFNTYASQWIFYTTPLITLLFFACGIIYTFVRGWEEKNKTSLLIFFWLLIPILRVTVPNTSIYGGVRQIMEYTPAMAILSGIGASYTVKLLHGQMVKRFKLFSHSAIQPLFFLQLFILLSFISIAFKIISLHPNESIYFNPLIGGLKGAKEKNIPGWGNSLGNPYRQAKDWLNEHAEKNSKVALVHELVSNIPNTLLREDIKYSNTYRSGPKREGEYVVGVTHYGTYEDFYHRKYLERFLIPVYEVKVDGVAILKIWKNDNLHTKAEYREPEKEIPNVQVSILPEKGRLVIAFPEVVKLTKIIINYHEEDCIIPPEGRVRISKDGHSWTSLPGSFIEFTGFSWFQPIMEKGKLQYLFASDEARYVRFSRNTEDSCLLVHPVEVRAWEI